jgi:hypothetical protein
VRRDQSAIFNNAYWSVFPAFIGEFGNRLDQHPSPTEVFFKKKRIRLADPVIRARFYEKATLLGEILSQLNIKLIDGK